MSMLTRAIFLKRRIIGRIHPDADRKSRPAASAPEKNDEDMKLTLHIGDPKTGTSSIQRALQLGVIESAAGRVSGFMDKNNNGNAVSLARSFWDESHADFGKAVRQKVWHPIRRVKRWLKSSDADYPVISSEFFSGANPETVHREFTRHFPAISKNMTVIAYVRPHPGRLLSAYTERVKCGYTTANFETWLPKFLESGILFYAPRFRQWREVFQQQFILRPFIRDQLVNGDVVDDFFSEVFSGQDFSVRETINENQSVSLKSLAGLRRFNQKLAPVISSQGRIALSRMVKDGIPDTESGPKASLDRDSASRIADFCRDDAHALDTEFFSRPLFTDALDQAIERAAGPIIDLTLRNHFSAERRRLLDTKIDQIIAILPTEFATWHRHYKETRRLYHCGADRPTEGGGDLQKRLHELCGIIA